MNLYQAIHAHVMVVKYLRDTAPADKYETLSTAARELVGRLDRVPRCMPPSCVITAVDFDKTTIGQLVLCVEHKYRYADRTRTYDYGPKHYQVTALLDDNDDISVQITGDTLGLGRVHGLVRAYQYALGEIVE